MNKRGKMFHFFTSFQILSLTVQLFGLVNDSAFWFIAGFIGWGIFTVAAQESYDNLLERIKDLEKKKEDDENGD